MDFCTANSLRECTDFQKPAEKQATFRENTTPLGCTQYTAENYAQLDFFLTRQKHRNHCTDVRSHADLYLPTDHFLVEMQIRMRLAAISETWSSILKVLKPTRRQWQQYNESVTALYLSPCEANNHGKV